MAILPLGQENNGKVTTCFARMPRGKPSGMSLKSRVQYRMTELGMNAAEVSKKAGFAPTFVRDLVEGRKKSVRADSLAKLAKSLNTSTDWLNGNLPMEASGDKPVRSAALSAPALPDDFLTVPIYDLRASAGPGSLGEDGEPMGYQPYRTQQLSRLTRSSTDSLAVITVGGDSMWETLHDGDQVLVDLSVNRVVRDGIYILSFEDELLVKRCQRDLSTGDVIVRSDNAAYREFRVTEADRLDVKGRVIWIGRALG